MDPGLAVQLALGLLAAGTRAWERHQAASAALQRAIEENRPPTPEEWTALRDAGLEVDARLTELLGT